MSTSNELGAAGAFELSQNFQRINFLLQRLFLALSRREIRNPGVEGPGQPFYLRAMLGQAAGMLANPMKAFTTHLQFWQNTTALYAELTQAMLTGQSQLPEKETDKDSRFADEDWSRHPFFYYLKRQYQIMSAYLESLAAAADIGEEKKYSEQIHFFTRQLVDLFSPTNFLASNPVAIRKAVETNGRSLVEGLENLVKDLERSGGDLLVTLSDPEAFRIGETIAATPGRVVCETPMFQLIRYAPPSGEPVYERPLLLVPPWINKFYILDLQPQTSIIRWLTEQGYAVHVMSWRNPGPEMHDWGLDTYVFDGVLEAIKRVNALCETADCNVAGYCIGGTALAIALAWLSRQEGPSPVRSATFLTSLTDFEDPGPLKVFIDESFVSGIMLEAQKKGYLDNRLMARTFSYLRPNDLIYGPAVKAYLLGEPPPKFDLLFWNEDSTRLPERMAREYLVHLYYENEFAREGYDLRGDKVRLGDIDLPHYVVACEKDHIAPWEASFQGLAQLKGEGRFVLAQSGHIAGVVNPPQKKKYGYWVSNANPIDRKAWREASEARNGSWWPDWAAWLSERSGEKQAPRSRRRKLPDLGPAPGSYVLE